MPKIEPEMSHQTWCSRRWQCKKVFSGHGHPLPWPRQKTNGACEKTGDTCFRCVSSQILCLKKAENDLHPRLPALKSGLWILYDMTFFDWETESIAIESFRFHLDWVWVIPKEGHFPLLYHAMSGRNFQGISAW